MYALGNKISIPLAAMNFIRDCFLMIRMLVDFPASFLPEMPVPIKVITKKGINQAMICFAVIILLKSPENSELIVSTWKNRIMSIANIPPSLCN